MKKRVGILFAAIATLLIMTSSSITNGIEFKGMTVAEAKVLASQSNKLIFIDCYTDWCGPCKSMAATTFVDPEVGQLFNDNFINLKVEMEKNADGPALAAQYKVRVYPTLIIIDSEGNLVKKVEGLQRKDGMIMFGKSALNK